MAGRLRDRAATSRRLAARPAMMVRGSMGGVLRGDTSAAAPSGGGLRRGGGQRGRGHQRESGEEPAERGSGVVARTAGVLFGSPRRGQVRRYTRLRPWRVERAVQGRAIRRLSVLPMPPTELADGFGREAALPAPSGAREQDSPQYCGGSPARPPLQRCGRRFGGVRSDSPDGDATTGGPGHGIRRYAVVTI